ncbi:MAG: helical backbone metal receptor, partial [Calditrichota bacterium]
NSISLKNTPKRIVSLVPSQTELLYDLGLDAEVVGITRHCIEPPEWLKRKTKVGGTKKFYFDRINELRPDLIIGNHEENYQEGIKRLQQNYPIWMSDIITLEDSLNMIRSIGELTNTSDKAENISSHISTEFRTLKKQVLKRAAYFIWKNPYMVAGGGTFIDQMLLAAGFENVFGGLARYPEITIEQLIEAKPEVLLLSSEPFPFAEKDCAEFREQIADAMPLVVDGMAFSWYGSRLQSSPAYFKELQNKIA